ncbi:MAG: tRNA pseudouridine(38-40) synthase TruA [bacterium]
MVNKRNIRLLIEYNGSNYHGWQSQGKNQNTIQDILEIALKKILAEKVTVLGSGRTDSGVHALGQVANFKTNSTLDVLSLGKALNNLLPRDIIIKEASDIGEDFNARFKAISKEYRYTILNRPYSSAFHYQQVWFIPNQLDLKAMREASKYLIGEHDFNSFRSLKGAARNSEIIDKNCVRSVSKLEIKEEKNFIEITIAANGFLRYMVRNILGTLVLVAKKKIPPEEVEVILGKKDRKFAGPTAPPYGLCLMKVEY